MLPFSLRCDCSIIRFCGIYGTSTPEKFFLVLVKSDYSSLCGEKTWAKTVVSWIYCASLGSIFSGRRECSCGFNTRERSKNVVLLIKGHNNFPIIQLHSATWAIATFSYCHGSWTTKSNYMGQKQSQISKLGSQQIQVWNLILLGETIFAFINWPIQARNWL